MSMPPPELKKPASARKIARLGILVLICLMPSLFSAFETVRYSVTRTHWIPESANDTVLWCVLGWLFLLSIPASLVLMSSASKGKSLAARSMNSLVAVVACIYLNAQIAVGAHFLFA